MKLIVSGCIHCGALTPAINGVCEDCASARSSHPRDRRGRQVRVRKTAPTRKLAA